MLTRSILCLGLIVLLLLLSQPLLAQTSLPACTAEIADIDRDGTNDNDGADGIIDIDKDGDGLIEICDLEGINEMRYQLDGSSYTTSADATTITQGCPRAGCRGYELVKDLDFNADASYRTTSNKVTWTTSTGWSPIGSNSNRFSSVFEGNGHTITDLYINRSSSDQIGLFAVTTGTAKINNIKLSDVNVTGDGDTGSLVGINDGSIISIDVTGTVNGNTSVGGLVGENNGHISLCVANVMVTEVDAFSSSSIGGLVGSHENGVIRESRASGNVMGYQYIGGLVGWNEGSIANTYAEGTVSGFARIGGLVGLYKAGRITNSYAIGRTSGDSEIGGLVWSDNNSGLITASYWDTDTTEQPTSEGGEGRTTVQLQSPLAPGLAETDTYYGWSNEVWYFGSTNTYPVLRFTVDADGDGILDGDADNRVDIDQDGDGLIEIYDLEGLNEIRYQLDGSGYRASAYATKITRGCPATGCRGYELMKDLDFNTDDSYRSAASNKTAWTDPNAAGWQPIGNSDDGFFNSVLEGNGHTIAHLYINRSDEDIVGLLGSVAFNAQIQNVRLVNVNVKGGLNIGSLAGLNDGIIINVRVTGTVSGRSEVGGLTSRNANQIISSFANVTVTASQDFAGGLVGGNSISNVGPTAFISESGASGNVIGDRFVGGLSGRNFGNIINSYATGSATGSNAVGGLVGLCNTDCIIENTYAVGTVIGTSTVGGLVGDHSGLVIASYWDTQTSGQSASPGGDSKTTAELQSPTAPGATAMATYYGWSADIWDFGNATKYPLLRVSVADPDRDGDMVLDVTDIDDDNDGLIEIHTIDDLHEIRHQVDGSGKKQNAEDTNNTTGCPPLGCIGYELARSLDFNDVNSYRDYRINTEWTVADYANDSDHGWHPLPAFRAIFNGNGHIIRNLQINRVEHNNAGLFGVLHLQGRIEHVELVYPNVRGQSNVGGLVGNNNGVISDSYVRDYDTDASTRDTSKYIEAISGSVGGLVGRNNGGGASIGDIINSGAVIDVQIKQNTSAAGINANAGGLAGFNLNSAEIINSYARGNVKGPCGVGGLVANNFSTEKSDPEQNSKIINSYATGDVITGFGNCNVDGNVRSGGLAAVNSGLISNSYTTSCWASGTADVPSGRRGGVVQNNSGRINNSYYQTECDGLQQTPSGSNRTQNQLRQLPTASNLYSEWLVNEWDFGTDSEYPLIRYTVGSDKDNPECGTLSLSACNALIKNQGRTDDGSPAANPSFVSGSIVTSIDAISNVGAVILQPPQFNLANSKYKLYVQDTRTNPTDEMEVDLIFGSNYQFSNCLLGPTSMTGIFGVSCTSTKGTFNFDRSHTFTFDIEYTSPNPNAVYSPFSLEVIPVATSRLFTSNNILEEIIAVDKISSFTLEPLAFDTDITNYKLHVQDTRTSSDQQMHIRLMISSSYDFRKNSCGTNINSLSDGQGSIDCPFKDIFIGGTIPRVVYRELNSKFNREHTISFDLIAFNLDKTYNIQIIPDILFSSVSVIVDSEVNGEPATFIDDSAVMRVKEGDTVRMNVADSFVVRDGIDRPLSYHWYSSSGPTLISGELRGQSISFDIGDTMFRDSGSGDAIVTLEVRDKSDTAATPVIQEIPIRIFGRLSLISDAAEVMRDPADKTLHRVVLAPDQPQAIITARALNETLTVDDSDGKVSAKNGDGTSLASEITVQLEVGNKVEFDIIATDSDNNATTHTVQVFRRSGAVSLQDIEITDITFDEAISAPGSYVGILPIGMTATDSNQITVTAGETNPIDIRSITVDEDGDGTSTALEFVTDKVGEFAAPGTELIITLGTSVNLTAGSVMSITIRTRDAYIDETRVSETLADLPYNEGVYTITIENEQPIDDDNDGLIDIYTLEDLDEMRNQYTNMPSTCGSNSDLACEGFELRRSLDFNDAESYQSGMTDPNWTTSTGWTPIGSADEPFNRVFDGNGFTISGLYINRPQSSNVGLFSVLSSEVKNIGLLDVNIQGGSHVGGLVGGNRGSIINSYATGAVIGMGLEIGGLVGRSDGGSIINSYASVVVTATGDNIGGLVGYSEDSNIINSYATGAVIGTAFASGGLVGNNSYNSHIINSYASGAVRARIDVGGLVGWNQGHLRNAYAKGDVSLTGTSDNNLGGLVGRWVSTGSIRNSYAIGRVLGADNARNAGGLIGFTTGTVVSSYWDGEASGWNISDGGDGVTSRTTMELQSPIAPGATTMDVYYGWRNNNWDFGSSEEYPALRYVGGMNACTTDISTPSDLPQCGSLLPNQGRAVVFAVSEVTISSQPAANNDGTINEGSNVNLMVNAIGGSEVYNFAWSQTSGNALELGSSDGATLDITIPPDFIAEDATTTTLTFTVMVDDGMSTISRSKMITITKASLVISEVMLSAATIAEGSTATVTFDVSGGTGIYQYAYKLIAGADEIALPSLTPPAVLVMPADIVAAADSERVVELNITVSDGGGRRVEHNEELTIQKVDNGLANIEASRATSTTLMVQVGIDPDGDATTPNYAYQWQRAAEGTAQWMGISGENDASYTISDDLADTSGKFRVQVTYTDGQGYQVMLTSNEISYVPPSELTPLIASNIELNVQPSANADGTINEGSTATLTFDVSGGTGIYQYESKIDDAAYTQFRPPFIYSISDDFIAADATSQTVTLTIRVSDQSAEIEDFEHTEELLIRKTNKGSVDINISITSATLTTTIVGADPDGAPNPTSYTYQWQTKTGSEWMNIDDADDASYTISGDLAETSGKFRVQVTYTDGQDYQVMLTSNEISYIPPSELTPLIVSNIELSVQPPANADGTINEGSTTTLTFDVSGGTGIYQYAYKLIAGADEIALPSLAPPAVLVIPTDIVAAADNKRVVELNITVNDDSGQSVEHNEELTIQKVDNGLAKIEASRATSRTLTIKVGIDPDGDATTPNYAYQWQWRAAEGTAQWMDISGENDASYTISGDLADTSGKFRVQVTYTDGQDYQVMLTSNEISYIPPSELTPLIVSNIELSVQPPANADGTINEGSTTTLTFDVSGGTGIYQYAYKLIAGADEIALPSLAPPAVLVIPTDIVAAADNRRVVELNITVNDDSGQRVEHKEELTIQKVDNGLAKIEASRATSRTLTIKVGIDPDGDATTPNYAYQWQWRAAEGTAQWMGISGENDASYTISDDLAETSGKFRVQVIYTDGQGYRNDDGFYSNEIRYTPPSELPPLIVSNIKLSVQPSANADGTINEGSMATLTFDVSSGTGVYQYASKIDDAAGYTPFQLPFIYSIADDFIATNTTSQTVRLTIRVSDQAGKIFEHTEELHILKTNNGSADINISISSATLTAIVGADPDGDPNPTSYTYQWQTKTGSEWMNIDSVTDISYTISGDLASAGGEFRVQVTYIDGQGYKEIPTSNEIRYTPPGSGLRIRTKVFLEGPLR